jgi:hypothetical protein
VSLKRRAVLRGAVPGALAAAFALPACGIDLDPVPGRPAPPRDRAAGFNALGPSQPPQPVSGPDARWAAAADEPASVVVSPEGLRLTSFPSRRAWASPHLPVAPLDGVLDEQIEDVSWSAEIAVERRFFIVCELRFAAEPGAILIQATPYDLQVTHDPERPSGGRSESVSRVVSAGRAHYWRLRLAAGRLDLLLDGAPVWSATGPRALARVAFGETRTDDEHGGTMLLRDLVYVRRPVAG